MVNLYFDEEEMAILEDMSNNPAYSTESLGEVHAVVGINSSFDYTIGEIAKSAKKNGGVHSFGIRMNTAEAREVTVEEFREIAKRLKQRMEIVQQVSAIGDQDTVEQI